MKNWWFRSFRLFSMAFAFMVIIIILTLALFRDYSFANLAALGLCILTAIYAFATILVVYENRKTLREMQQARLDSVKPALSLQPEGFTFGGGFSGLYLVNSGGVARDVKIDLEVSNPSSKELLFITTIDRGHKAYLQIGGDVQDKGGYVKVKVFFKDSYSQGFTETLEIDFSELKKEGRKIRGQYSEEDRIISVLNSIKSALDNIKGKIK